jgi:hypothetical protein
MSSGIFLICFGVAALLLYALVRRKLATRTLTSPALLILPILMLSCHGAADLQATLNPEINIRVDAGLLPITGLIVVACVFFAFRAKSDSK